MISSFKAKIGAEVEIRANETTYRGILKGISDHEIYLRTQLKTWVIPQERIQSFRYIEKTIPRLDRDRRDLD